MPFIRTGGFVTHYTVEGKEGAPVLMMGNSLGTNLHMWDLQVPDLARRFRVLRYDKRGHGLTEAPKGVATWTIDDLAGDALALADALKIDRFHWCGLSIGGMIGQRLGSRAPGRVMSLALCNTANRMAEPQLMRDRAALVRKSGLEAVVGGVMQRWFTEKFRAENPDTIAGFTVMLTRGTAAGYAGCCDALAAMNLEADDRRIACPVQVLIGTHDVATPPAAGRAIAALIKNAKVVEVPAAHISTAERPAEVSAALVSFLA